MCGGSLFSPLAFLLTFLSLSLPSLLPYSQGTLLGLLLAAVEQAQLYMKRSLCGDLTRSLGDHFLSLYMSHHNFDELAQLFPDADPVQLMSEDVKQFAVRLTDLLPLLQPVTEIAWFIVKIHQLVGEWKEEVGWRGGVGVSETRE